MRDNNLWVIIIQMLCYFWGSCEEEKQSHISHILVWLSAANYSWAHERDKAPEYTIC